MTQGGQLYFTIYKEVSHESDIYPKYKYFVTIGYSWSDERDFHDQNQYLEEPGVYRLKKDSEIVRIGEGINIRDRLVMHHKDFSSEADTFDFEIVPNDEERKKEEKRLLELFKGSVGRLPKFNMLTK